MTKRHSSSQSLTPTITFWGAARAVTGSMHLLEVGDRHVLLDCGLVRGRRDEARRHNARFPFPPDEIDAVVLSHAHVDHCGNLPNLVRQGFSGPIFCTPATRDLVSVMLTDSARIQEEAVAVAGVVGRRADTEAALFTRAHVRQVLAQCVAVPYGVGREAVTDIELRFADAGHILGSAMASLSFAQAGRARRVTFTGDVGRRGLPYLRDGAPLPAADLVLCESTYGGRVHDTADSMAAKLSDLVRRSAARGGRVLIPAFSLGRTQIVAFYLQEWTRAGLLPRIPIYVDSPLAAEVAKVYAAHPAAFRDNSQLDDPPVHYIESREESDYLAEQPGPCVVIASGGMCEGGRILQHLRRNIDDPRASVVLVSYQAPDTVGAQLLEKKPTVRFHGRTWNKWIEVLELKGFTGHADHNDLLSLLATHPEAKVRLVHGEPDQAEALAAGLRDRGFRDVRAPELGEQVRVA
jgi:metallo-beta-lactamase family protein